MIENILHEENINRIALINEQLDFQLKLLCGSIAEKLKNENDIVVMNVIGQSLFNCMAHIIRQLDGDTNGMQILLTMIVSFLQRAVKPDMRKEALDTMYKDLLRSMEWNIERDAMKSKLH